MSLSKFMSKTEWDNTNFIFTALLIHLLAGNNEKDFDYKDMLKERKYPKLVENNYLRNKKKFLKLVSESIKNNDTYLDDFRNNHNR